MAEAAPGSRAPSSFLDDRMRFGRSAESAIWILTVLREGPRSSVALLDGVRALDGPVGPGTLYGAVARLERLRLIEQISDETSRFVYRLTEYRGNAPVAPPSGATQT